jgi:hypothetical protein
MSCEISYRPLTPEEAHDVRLAHRGAEGCVGGVLLPVMGAAVFVFLGVVLTMCVATILEWITHARPDRWRERAFALVLLAGVLAGIFFFRKQRRHGAQRLRELDAGRVELLRIEGARLVEQEADEGEGPIYYFGVAADKILYLEGPWLHDDPSFPSSSFTIHRLPASGEVLRVDAAGERLVPEARLRSGRGSVPDGLAARLARADFRDSLMIDGSFDELVARATE